MIKRALAEPWRSGVEQRARKHRDRTISVVGQFGAERLAAIRHHKVVTTECNGFTTLIDERLPTQLQIDCVQISGRLGDVAPAANDFVARALACGISN